MSTSRPSADWLPSACALLLALASASGRGAAQVVPVSAISAAGPGGVRVVVSVDHLLLRGGSLREALDRLREVAPLDEHGGLANAITDFDLAPHLVPVRRGPACYPERVAVDVRVRTLLPAWTGRDQAPAGERRRWDDFLKALASHENAHRDITLRHAEVLRQRLVALAAGSCPRLVRRVDGTIRRLWSELSAAHAALDAADGWSVHR